mmetsp:Transcript_80951/g.203693  ORF Transcript_80951/g.203693 Transcript_80951/m.203693 type:complete len:961 (-) Transcript_80951:54-2936(-)
MVDGEDYYAILGVERDATTQEIRQRFRKLALTNHPDRGGDAGEFANLNKAYEVLSDAKARDRYDNTGRTQPLSLEEQFRNSFFGGDSGKTVMEERRERERREKEREAERQRAEDFGGLRMSGFEDDGGLGGQSSAFGRLSGAADAARREALRKAEEMDRRDAARRAAAEWGNSSTGGYPDSAVSSSASTAQPAAATSAGGDAGASTTFAWKRGGGEAEGGPLSIGDRVEIHSVKARAEMNGLTGIIVAQQEDRWQICLDDGAGDKLVKARNIRRLDGCAGPADASTPSAHAAPSLPVTQQPQDPSPRFCIVASCHSWEPREMEWDPDRRCCRFFVEFIRSTRPVSFQIWKDGDNRKCLHPDRPDVSYSGSSICGPDAAGHGKNWAIGVDSRDKVSLGSCFEVRLHLNDLGIVLGLDWIKRPAGAGTAVAATTPSAAAPKAAAGVAHPGPATKAGAKARAAPPKPASLAEATNDASCAALGVPPREYEVVHDLVYVRQAPSLESRAINQRSRGAHVAAVEETFEGWVKLDGKPGWILKELRTGNSIRELLRPIGPKPEMLAASEVAPTWGPKEFEVVFGPQVVVRNKPSKGAPALGIKKQGQVVLAETQTYNGWVRLAEGAGWMLTADPQHGQLLRCLYAEEIKGKREAGRSAQNELMQASAGQDVQRLQQAIAQSRKAGVDSSQVAAAEASLTRLRQHEQRRRELRTAVDQAERDATQLREVLDTCVAEGFAEEAAVAQGCLDRLLQAQDREAHEHAELLDALARATASGDMTALKRARDAAKKGGVPTKEIARVYALHSRKEPEAAPLPAEAAAAVDAEAAEAAEAARATETARAAAAASAAEAARSATNSRSGTIPEQPAAEVAAAGGFGEEGCELGSPFDGAWTGLSGEFMASIRGRTIFWCDGPAKELQLVSNVAVSTEMFDEVFSAEMDAQGRLVWSDGDIWTRTGPPQVPDTEE